MQSKIRAPLGDRVFYTVDVILLTLIFLLVLYPLIYIVSSSFSDPQAVITGEVVLLPVRPSIEGYRAVFQYRDVWVGYGNSLFYAVVGTALNVVMTVLAAYPLSRRDFRGRNIFMLYFTFTMFFGGGLIPFYLLVRNLGLINTRLAMIVPGAMGVWNVIITRTFFQSSIPVELYEAARVDGSSNVRMLTSIVIPLSGPILAVIALFYAVGHWNAFFSAMIFLRNRALYPLQLFLREILIQYSQRIMDQQTVMDDKTIEMLQQREWLQALLQYALIVVAVLPVMSVYPFVQKYFVRGIMIGAIKG